METKIRSLRVRVLTIYLMIGRWLVSFPNSLFLPPHQSTTTSPLVIDPLAHPAYSSSLHTMSTPSKTVHVSLDLPVAIGAQDEVWGSDNVDFYEGFDPLVHVVKRSGDLSCADPHVRLIYHIMLVSRYSSTLPPTPPT